MITIIQPKRRYIENEIYSNYSNINGEENYAEIEKLNNNGDVRIHKNINGKKTDYYSFTQPTFSDNNYENPKLLYYAYNNTKRHKIHKKSKKPKTPKKRVNPSNQHKKSEKTKKQKNEK